MSWKEHPLAQRSSRKRRKERQRSRVPETPPAATVAAPPDAPEDTDSERMARGYERGRIKDEEARAALVPLAPGERPRAVQVAFWVALLFGVANLVALAIGYDPSKRPQTGFTVLGSGVMFFMAWGLWNVRYWAALGMQALLAITVLIAAGALITARNFAALIFTLSIIAGGGTLFWFLIKSMARIQMPKPPGAR